MSIKTAQTITSIIDAQTTDAELRALALGYVVWYFGEYLAVASSNDIAIAVSEYLAQ